MRSRLADERTIDRGDRAARSPATASRTSRVVMAWSVMHRFNALSRYLPAPRGADALERIRARYWPVLA